MTTQPTATKFSIDDEVEVIGRGSKYFGLLGHVTKLCPKSLWVKFPSMEPKCVRKYNMCRVDDEDNDGDDEDDDNESSLPSEVSNLTTPTTQTQPPVSKKKKAKHTINEKASYEELFLKLLPLLHSGSIKNADIDRGDWYKVLAACEDCFAEDTFRAS